MPVSSEHATTKNKVRKRAFKAGNRTSKTLASLDEFMPMFADEAEKATWARTAREVNDVRQLEETRAAKEATRLGLTGVAPRHIWPADNGDGFEVRPGLCPLSTEQRPKHLQGINLNICFRLPGVVIKMKEKDEDRYFRLRRNPKAGELEKLMEQEKKEGGNDGRSDDGGVGSPASVPASGQAL